MDMLGTLVAVSALTLSVAAGAQTVTVDAGKVSGGTAVLEKDPLGPTIDAAPAPTR
ncbi:hypothetical protein TPR58_02130 [Sphingomonas sp. HF-S3]|jgi:adhesin HecA-like repeat protein|uniref:Uncharacterized protein n=1 Tax=Sphingomonas rustica TaxID=3103142 RepID=A0ABV0B2Z1_9SPHN